MTAVLPAMMHEKTIIKTHLIQPMTPLGSSCQDNTMKIA